MRILGFNCYGHDSSASLIVDDKVVFAVEEERLNRKKHYGGVPILSIKECLKYADLNLSDIDHITFFWKPIISYVKIPTFLFKYFDKVPSLIFEMKNFSVEENLGMLNYLGEMRKLPKLIKKLFPKEKNIKFKFHFIEHHICHAASAFFCSPFKESAIITIDGAGEWTTAMLAFGKENKIKKIAEVITPHSLGAFYQAISRYLGFKLIEGPGKLMGLSSYGNPNAKEYKLMNKLITLTKDGMFKLDMSYFSYHYTRRSGVTDKFLKLFGPSNNDGKDWTDQQMNIAAAAQHVVEDIFIHMAKQLKKITKSDNLCIAGGVGLNSVANGVLLKSNIFKNIFIQPGAGDSGTSLGSALYLNNCILNRNRNYVMKSAFLGPRFTQDEYQKVITKFRLAFVKKKKNYIEFAAKKLAEGKIIAWFQERLEFGPRALGNRSILANPCKKEMRDILNTRVKFRESFRPYAAIVIAEDCAKYFDSSYPSPFMLMVYNVKKEYLKKIPSITHVDHSVRVQTVTSKDNPLMYDLLQQFKKEAGYSVLINTSFNIRGEPIVCTPYDAVYSFVRSNIDYLIMGNYIVAKAKNKRKLN